MNEENEVYETIGEETVGEEEYEDECVGCGATVATLAVGALGGILLNRIYRNQVKPRLRKAKERWAERKALKAAPSEDDYDEVEDDEPDKAPRK